MMGVWEKQKARESRELFSWLCLPTAEKSPWEGGRTRAAVLTGLNSLLPLSIETHTLTISWRDRPCSSYLVLHEDLYDLA